MYNEAIVTAWPCLPLSSVFQKREGNVERGETRESAKIKATETYNESHRKELVTGGRI